MCHASHRGKLEALRKEHTTFKMGCIIRLPSCKEQLPRTSNSFDNVSEFAGIKFLKDEHPGFLGQGPSAKWLFLEELKVACI